MQGIPKISDHYLNNKDKLYTAKLPTNSPCMQDSNAQARIGARTAARAFCTICPLLFSSEIKLPVPTSGYFTPSYSK